MTDTIVNTTIVTANICMLANAALADNPIFEAVQSGTSVAAIMSIFLWREAKRADRYEKLYDEERKVRLTMCQNCKYNKVAQDEFIEHRTNE